MKTTLSHAARVVAEVLSIDLNLRIVSTKNQKCK